MATRATISYFDEDTKKYHSIYLHNDGYLEWAGMVLKRSYSSLEKVKGLVALGSISILGDRIAPIGKHSFKEPEKGTTVAYSRDRGEDFSIVRPIIGKKLRKGDMQEFNYLFVNGRWSYTLEGYQPVP